MINKLKKGDLITADLLNELGLLSKRDLKATGARNNPRSSSSRRLTGFKPFEFQCENTSGSTIPANSVFGIAAKTGSTTSEPIITHSTNPGSILVTNPEPILNSKPGLVQSIDTPRLVVSDATVTVDGTCGPTNGSDIASSSGTGLRCLAIVDSSSCWVVAATGEGGSDFGKIKFVIVSASSALGMGATGCDFVNADVTQISCGLSGVTVGDEVQIYDPAFCHFNLPIELLVGLSGTASKMVNPFTSYDLNDAVDCVYELLTQGACIWEVDSLCCSEEETIV